MNDIAVCHKGDSALRISLLDLPNELLLWIAGNLKQRRQLNAFARTNRRLYSLLNAYLYRHNVEKENSSALFWAAKHGQEATAKMLLLSEGADVRATTRDGVRQTALHQASLRGHVRIVEILIRNGADVEAEDCAGMTSLHLAVRRRFKSVTRMLLENGADIRKPYPFSYHTVLHEATWGSVAMVQLLLEKGADIEALDENKQTPLHYAVGLHRSHWRGNLAIVRYLIENHANPHARDIHGQTPRDLAAENQWLTSYRSWFA